MRRFVLTLKYRVPVFTVAATEKLRQHISRWPELWKIDDREVEIGRHLAVSLGPFLFDLLQQGLADKTFARLRDHIEMLGGEIIRRRYDDPDLAKRPINELLSNLISAKEDRHHQRQM